MMSCNFDTEAKKYINTLLRTQEVPKFAQGFAHVIQCISYCADVASGRILRSKDIVQACTSTLTDLFVNQHKQEFEFRFDPVKAERVCYFIETLKHVKGKWANTRIKLEAWQCDIVCNIFGWLHKSTGFRRYNECYLEIPRKNGKSVLACGIALYMLLADNEAGAEVYCGAKSKAQAGEVFEPARMMILNNRPLMMRYKPDVKIQSIKLPDGSKFLPIIGKPIDGASPSCSILDEIHQHPDDKLYECQQTGLGSRSQPLIFMITTAGYDLLSFCKEKHDENIDNIYGIVPDDTIFSRIYNVDSEDIDKLKNPLDYPETEREAINNANIEIIKKANPNYGVSLMDYYLLDQCKKGFKKPSDWSKFLTKHLNCWVNSAESFFDMLCLKNCIDKDLNIEDFSNDLCVVAVDLSSKLDLGCIMVAFARIIDDNIHYYLFPEFFLPEHTVEDSSNKNHSKYQAFKNEICRNSSSGRILTVCEGYETDYIEMTKVIGEYVAQKYHPCEVIFDNYNGLQMEQTCERKYGLNVVEFSKTTAFFSPAMKEMDSAIIAGRFHYDGNKCLGWNISNVESKTDKNDNEFPRKANLRYENKIDGAVCGMMAIGRLMILCDRGNDNEHFKEIYSNY